MARIRTNSVVVLGLLIVLSTAQLLCAGPPVDPSTLNPPPPPAFNPVCEKAGNQTICTVQFSDPPFGLPSGVVCGSGADAYEIFQFQNRSVLGHRYYDQSGNLTRRHFKEVVEGTLTNPLNHKTLFYSGTLTHLHDLATPGDITSGTENLTGSVRTYLPQGGTVLLEAGRSIIAGDGSLLRESGPHPIQDYFVFGDTAAVQPLCDALQ
jgi:hypothetical protein